MATIPLQDIIFPGSISGNVYTVPDVDNTLTQTGEAADAKKTGDEISSLKQDINDLESTKANVDGSYDTMTVGNAKQLVSTVNIEDKAPYLFRTSGGSADIGDREYDTLVGGSVAWNQQINNGDFADTSVWKKYNCDFTVSDGIASITKSLANPSYIYEECEILANHVYYGVATLKGAYSYVGIIQYESNLTLCGSTISNPTDGAFSTEYFIGKLSDANKARFVVRNGSSGGADKTWYAKNVMCFDLTQMFGSTIADYVYGLESATAGTGIAWLKKYGFFTKPYYAYDAGSMKSVGNLVSHDCVGFNAWDQEIEQGDIDSTTGANKSYSGSRYRSKNYIPVVPGANYYYTPDYISIFYYDADKNFVTQVSGFLSPRVFTVPSNVFFMRFVKTTASVELCINLSWDGERNGEYEAYTKHSYPLDSDVVLRGIPKLDSGNNLYYDGDEYESDGTVTRKYGVVDLGTLTWGAQTAGENSVYRAQLPSAPKANAIGICSKYTVVDSGTASTLGDKCMIVASRYWSTTKWTVIKDSSYDTASDLTTALDGVYLVYELDNETTESADPFQSPQIVDDFGTEEYVLASDAFPMPVGHVTQYQPNLRAKVEMSPNSPDGDGDYLVRQTSGQNEYVEYTSPVPADPTEDGTYVLKLTKSGSTVTKTWVAET